MKFTFTCFASSLLAIQIGKGNGSLILDISIWSAADPTL